MKASGSFLEVIMITLTDIAAKKVAELLAEEGAQDLALRVSVKSGGCSGFSYDMYFDGDIAADDVTLTFGDVKVVVDPASAPMLQGASLDFKNSLTEQGFSISNPNAQRSCGCGKSFS
jgi:iron-sulfur cluster assembly protein/iron-sulfur cluster insertion protein